MQTHEHFTHLDEVQGGSNRSFGLVFVVVFIVIALFPLWGGGSVRLWSLAVAAVLGGIAMVRPDVLAPANRLWTLLGLALSKIVNPVVLGVLFYGVLTPTGLVVRAMNKDILRCRWDARLPSYWQKRDVPGPEPETMKNQF